jgi:hypothetical protein
MPNKNETDLGNGYLAEVEAWSGNRQPWRARVSQVGRFIGYTGGCKTPTRALDAARKLAAKDGRDAEE